MCGKWTLTLGAFALLACLAPASSHARHNPNGFVETSGWTFLFPLLNPYGAAPPIAVMDAEWVGDATGKPSLLDPAFNPSRGNRHGGFGS